MKAYLTEITLSYKQCITDEEYDELKKKYFPNLKFHELNHFIPWGVEKGSEAYIKGEEEYKAYLNQPRREILSSDIAVVDIKLFISDFPHLKFNVNGTREVELETPSQEAFMHEILQDNKRAIASMVSTFEKMAKRMEEHTAPETFNQYCEVHMGGGLLMTVNEITLLEDSCTDVLQSSLDSGWRILSVCVQPDGRRPDYVLGRYDPERSISSRAKRR